jgi:hypothetical protein
MWLVATVLDNAALESIVDSSEITKQREFFNIFSILYRVCHRFRLTKRDDYFQVTFDHLWSKQNFLRLLARKLAQDQNQTTKSKFNKVRPRPHERKKHAFKKNVHFSKKNCMFFKKMHIFFSRVDVALSLFKSLKRSVYV